MTAVTVSTDLADIVEQHLGDPYDTANPSGFAAVLAAHETGRPRTGDLLPDALTASAHPTPDAWLHALRALYRRSPGLGSTVRTGLHEKGPRAAALAVGACVGALDSALRVTVRHLRGRLLYGAPAIDIPQLREVLAGVHADLLLCDVLTTLAVRGEDALPAREGAHELAVLGLVPRVLQGALDRLSVLMGSRFYVREGETGIFQLLLNGAQRELFAPAHGPRPAPGPLPLTELVTAPCAAALLDPELARAAPGRVLTTPARRSPQPSGDVQQRLYADLIRRYEGARTFDLVERRIPDRP